MNRGYVFAFFIAFALVASSFAVAENETNNEVGAMKEKITELKGQISNLKNQILEIKEQIQDRIRTRNCTEECPLNVEGKNISIKDLSDEKREIIANKINAKTGLNLTAEDIDNKTMLRAYLSNGRWALIKIMPSTASARALERLRAKCGERNCTVELKEVGAGNETRARYDVKAEKESKILGIFKKKMAVEAEVDAETGDVMKVKKPWWAFLAKEQDETPDVTA